MIVYIRGGQTMRKKDKGTLDGKGAKYTRARVPVELVYFEVFEDKIEAMKRDNGQSS